MEVVVGIIFVIGAIVSTWCARSARKTLRRRTPGEQAAWTQELMFSLRLPIGDPARIDEPWPRGEGEPLVIEGVAAPARFDAEGKFTQEVSDGAGNA